MPTSSVIMNIIQTVLLWRTQELGSGVLASCRNHIACSQREVLFIEIRSSVGVHISLLGTASSWNGTWDSI